ncbi:MAG: AAA family ATPase [Paludibacteraceae bacterium]|nr:AAA family ATPase [Paludibacteraceae bacterium]
MLESFYQTHDYLVQHLENSADRELMNVINWNDRLIAIKGGRGVGKTDFLLAYAKQQTEAHPELMRTILYVNFNNFYFADHSLYEFASEFVRQGGRTLLLDQMFKYANWSKELRDCFFHFTNLQIIFSASPVMRLTENNSDIGHIVRVYNLRGYSFREYLNLKTGSNFPVFTMQDILLRHENITDKILAKVNPLDYFDAYLRQGYYPALIDTGFYNEIMVRMMNMMIEVDVLIIKQFDVASLGKIRKLLYKMMMEIPCGLNVTQLAEDIDISRATLLNYIKSLEDARLINLLYKDGKEFPMKPAKIYMQNPNLCFALPSRIIDAQSLAETFFYSSVYVKHKVNATDNAAFVVDGQTRFDVCAEMPRKCGFRYAAIGNMQKGSGKLIPLWLFGFLY